MVLVALLFSLAHSPSARAYPEMVRHHYSQCVNCHISPTGGGVLTQYGRSLARELVSMKPKPKDEGDAPQERWHFGGEARVLRLYLNNEYERSQKLIPMQLHGDGAYNADAFAAVLRLGAVGHDESVGFQAATAYGLYRITENLNLRAGRFLPGYGLNNSMHFIGTRGGLGFGFDDQRQGVEVSQLADRWGVMAAAFTKRDNDVGRSAYMVQAQGLPIETIKVAVNYWRENDERELYGAWAVGEIYGPVFASADWNWQKELHPDRHGFAYFTRLHYEIRQGLNAFVMSDNSQRDKERDYTRIDRFGPGVQVFPWTGVDFELAWLKEKNRMYSDQRGDYAYLLVHGYY